MKKLILIFLMFILCSFSVFGTTDQLTLWMSFDSDATDDVGSNDGVVRGSANHVSGCFVNGCYDFNKTGTGMINILDVASLRSNPITIMGVFKPRTAGETGKGVFVQKDGTGGIYLYSNANKSWGYFGSGQFDVANVPDTQYEAWQHIAWIFNGSHGRIYINGTPYGNWDPVPNNPSYSTGNWSIGNKPDGSRAYNGMVDEFGIYNKTLNDSEILSVYNILIDGYNPLTVPSTYYFSNDGNDTNDGLTTLTPKQTIAGMYDITLINDDKVLFNRDNTWECTERYCMNITSGVTYGAYGTGDRPKFSGGLNASNSSYWEDRGGNVFWSNDTFPYDVGNILFNFTTVGIKVNESRFLNESLEYWRNTTSNKVVLYLSENPANIYSSIIVCRDSLLFYGYNADNASIINLTLTCSGRGGIMCIGEQGQSTDNINIRDNEIYYAGGVFEDNSNSTRTGNGIGTPLNSTNITVTGNIVHDCWDAGLSLQSWSTAGKTVMLNNYYADNIVYDNYYNFELFNSDTVTGSRMENITIEYNTFVDAYGWSYNQRPVTDRAHNLRLARSGNDTSGIIIRNNVIVNSSYREFEAGMGTSDRWAGADPVMDYNFYNHTRLLYDMIRWTTGTKYTSVSAFKTGTGNEANGAEDTAYFVDQENNDYRPYNNSVICTMSPTGSFIGALPCVGTTTTTTTTSTTTTTTVEEISIARGTARIQAIIFTGLGLLALSIIVIAGLALTNENMDTMTMIGITVGAVALGVVIMVAYIILSSVRSALI